jgi:hypothetical protein
MPLKNPVTPPGIDPGIVRLVAQRLNHYTTPGLMSIKVKEIMFPLLGTGLKIPHVFNLYGRWK